MKIYAICFKPTRPNEAPNVYELFLNQHTAIDKLYKINSDDDYVLKLLNVNED